VCRVSEEVKNMGDYQSAVNDKAFIDAFSGGTNTIRQECSGNWVVDHKD
jgi:hypothetical protein